MILKTKNLFLFLILLITTSVSGQTDNQQNSELEIIRIRELTAKLDKRNPKKQNMLLMPEIDSVLDETIIRIEKQELKGLQKFTLKTNNTGGHMNIKFFEFYVLNNSLLTVSVYYNEAKKEHWKKIYFSDNEFSSMRFTRGLRVSVDEDYQKYLVAEKLLSAAKSNKY